MVAGGLTRFLLLEMPSTVINDIGRLRKGNCCRLPYMYEFEIFLKLRCFSSISQTPFVFTLLFPSLFFCILQEKLKAKEDQLYILPQYLANLTQPMGTKNTIYFLTLTQSSGMRFFLAEKVVREGHEELWEFFPSQYSLRVSIFSPFLFS